MKRPITKEERPILSGELALAINIIINSFAVVLMLYSGAGISAISSVPFAFWSASPLVTWDMDIPLSRTSRLNSDVFAKTLCPTIPF